MVRCARQWLAAFALLLVPLASPAAPIAKRPLTIDDVLDTERIDSTALSPDGEWVAAVVLRPAKPGEVYGRTAYETDPSRGDVWLISTRTGQRRALTNGAPQAAGYWCATWSPDGRRLAMLSTRPETGEPRGGDNVRLYVWDRVTNAITRMSDAPVMTMGRYGGGVDQLDLRGGADHGTIPHECGGDEKALFLWLDEHRILVATLPARQVSALIDQYGRPFREAARNAALLHDGREPTLRAVGSGAAREPRDPANSAILRMVDVTTRRVATVATVPTYPFRSELTLSISPDDNRLAVLATAGTLTPRGGRLFPNWREDAWTVERRLGFVDLTANASVRWVTMPMEGRYPLDLYGWPPDSRRVALRARSDGYATATPLFVAGIDGQVTRLGAGSAGDAASGGRSLRQSPVLWIDNDRLAARLTDPATKATTDWWVLGVDGAAANVTHGAESNQTSFARTADGHLVTVVGGQLVKLDPARATLMPVAKLPADAWIWPLDPDKPADQFLLAGGGGLYAMAADGTLRPKIQSVGPHIDAVGMAGDILVWNESGREGIKMRAATLSDGRTHDLLRLDGFMAGVAWGEARLIDYAAADGTALKALAILPPDYRPGTRYPTLAWLYGGYMVRGLDDYWVDPFMPGIYNLQLYAARGYVVLIPSMPLPRRGDPGEVYADIPNGVLPAVDRMVALGITDPDRLGAFGQSFGGYSTDALISQTNRFKAAVALAGNTDLVSLYGTFDPTARGYPGIEHEKSDNWAEIDQFGRKTPPPGDAAGYARNSPLSYADRIETPLLLIHGEFDIRGGSGQAEEMFTALYRQGKTARLLRYGGESHSLAQSPANVRDIYAQTVAWFDAYLKR